MKRRMEWTALVALVLATGAVACGGGENANENEAPVDTAAAAAPAPAPAPQQQQMGQPPEGATMAMVQQGHDIFTGKGNCYTCHGQDAKGTQLAPNLTDQEWIQIEQPVTWDKLQTLVKSGVPNPKQHPSPMPAMGGAQLSDDEVKAVTAYVYSLSHQGGAETGGATDTSAGGQMSAPSGR